MRNGFSCFILFETLTSFPLRVKELSSLSIFLQFSLFFLFPFFFRGYLSLLALQPSLLEYISYYSFLIIPHPPYPRCVSFLFLSSLFSLSFLFLLSSFSFSLSYFSHMLPASITLFPFHLLSSLNKTFFFVSSLWDLFQSKPAFNSYFLYIKKSVTPSFLSFSSLYVFLSHLASIFFLSFYLSFSLPSLKRESEITFR